MKTRYGHLTLADRRQIERWRLMKMSAAEIAERLGRTVLPCSANCGETDTTTSRSLS